MYIYIIYIYIYIQPGQSTRGVRRSYISWLEEGLKTRAEKSVRGPAPLRLQVAMEMTWTWWAGHVTFCSNFNPNDETL